MITLEAEGKKKKKGRQGEAGYLGTDEKISQSNVRKIVTETSSRRNRKVMNQIRKKNKLMFCGRNQNWHGMLVETETGN